MVTGFKKAKIALISIVLLAPMYMYAAEEFGKMNVATAGAKNVIQQTIGGVLWVLSLLPIGIGFFAAMKMKEYLENKEENSQHEPKWMKFGKVVFAFGGGVVFTFLLYGILGRTFLDTGFADTWDTLVVKFWKAVVVL